MVYLFGSFGGDSIVDETISTKLSARDASLFEKCAQAIGMTKSALIKELVEAFLDAKADISKARVDVETERIVFDEMRYKKLVAIANVVTIRRARPKENSKASFDSLIDGIIESIENDDLDSAAKLLHSQEKHISDNLMRRLKDKNESSHKKLMNFIAKRRKSE